MTSPKFNAITEIAIFDSLSAPLRALIRERDVHPSVVLGALLRGVSEDQIIALLTRKPDAKNSDNG